MYGFLHRLNELFNLPVSHLNLDRPNKKGAAGREHTPEDKNQAANRRANQIDGEGEIICINQRVILADMMVRMRR